MSSPIPRVGVVVLVVGMLTFAGLSTYLLVSTRQTTQPTSTRPAANNSAATPSDSGPALVIPTASPTAALPNSQSLPGLSALPSKSNFWQQLNNNTAATAYGEYAILQQLESAFSSQVTNTLNHVIGGQ